MMHSLLSQHWHAVRNLRPRLKEGVQALPRQLRGRSWVMLHDPLTQRFVRITPQLWRVLRLLDGQRTLDEVWDAACALPNATEGHLPIGQNELVQLLGQLYSNDLLQTQVSPMPERSLSAMKNSARLASNKAFSIP
jgi:putative peptide zinc metalloprotease protein